MFSLSFPGLSSAVSIDARGRAEEVSTPPVRLLIASHHPVVREGLLALLDAVSEELEPIGTVQSSEELFARIEDHRPDVVILDTPLSDEGTKVTRHIKEQYPETRVLLFSATRWGVEVCQALAEGAEGVVLKTAEAPELVRAIREAASGRGDSDGSGPPQPIPPDRLTNRETEVLQCVARGMSNAEIAFALSISVHTVRAHIEHILRKMHASDRAGAVAKGFVRGLIA